MTSGNADRNLLAGVLGLQTGLFSEASLIQAMQRWVFKKTKPIEDILLEIGALEPRTHSFLSDLVQQHLSLHGLSATLSLAKLDAVGRLHDTLDQLADDDIDASIERSLQAALKEPGVVELESTGITPSRFSDDERFQVLRPYARGGLGIVSIAEDTQLHREVALKEIQESFANDAGSRNRFLIEAEVTGRLEHPGIVPVYSLGATRSGSPFYAMRLIRGDSMKVAIAELHSNDQPLNVPEKNAALRRLVNRLIDVCNAIDYAHSRGVLHRDLKPGNIMLGRFGETLVVDWGLAKVGAKDQSHAHSEEPTVVPQSGDGSSETRMGSVVGTIAYMSPEQADGRLDLLGASADVYSLGATLYCILTGKPPVDSAAQEEMLAIVRRGDVVPAGVVRPDVPKPLDAICRKAMAHNRSQRYATAGALRLDLEQWVAGEPVSAYREPWAIRAGRWIRRHQALVTTTAGIILTSTLGLAIIAILVNGQNRALSAANSQILSAQMETKVERDNAIEQRDLALDNLKVARGLAMSMLDSAERELSKGDVSVNALLSLRRTLTEKVYDNFSTLHETNLKERTLSREYARVLRISSNLQRTYGKFDIANERLQKSLEFQRQIPADQRTPDETDFLAESLRELGANRAEAGKLSEAESLLKESLILAELLHQQFPEEIKYTRTTAIPEFELANIQIHYLNPEAARKLIQASRQKLEILYASESSQRTDAIMVAGSHTQEMHLLREIRDHGLGIKLSGPAISLTRKMLEKYPTDRDLRVALCQQLTLAAYFRVQSDTETEAALALIEEALQKAAELNNEKKSAGAIAGEAMALIAHSTYLRHSGQAEQAVELARLAKARSQSLLKQIKTPRFLQLYAEATKEEAVCVEQLGDLALAASLMAEAVATQTSTTAASPESKLEERFLNELKDEHTRINLRSIKGK